MRFKYCLTNKNIMKYSRISTFKDFVGELKVVYKRTQLPSQKVLDSRSASSFMRYYYDNSMDDFEEAKILHLNRNNCIVNITHLTKGSDSGTLIPVKTIIRDLCLIKTSSFILFHNHPSGNLKPSMADIGISKKLQSIGELIDVKLLDSIILTRESYYSLKDNLDI